MFILGINAYHGDSSACLVQDGRIIAAAEEERFRRLKHWAGFPSLAIAYCLAEAGIELDAVEHVAINSDPSESRYRRLAYVLSHRPHPSLLIDRLRNRHRRDSIAAELGQRPGAVFGGAVHRVEHHMAHLASCFLVSPFEQAVAVSIDGFGDFSSAAWGVGRDTEIDVENRVYFPHSLGIFYQALTQYLGFPYYGDEYKMMGLAPYGSPAYLGAMRDIVHSRTDGTFILNLKYFRHHRERIAFQWNDGSPQIAELFSPELEKLLGPQRRPDQALDQRHKDIARSAQAMYEEAFFNLLTVVQSHTRLTDLTLAGGCAMNSVANGKVRRMTPFRRVYVQAAAGDAGGAIGAAFSVWHKFSGARSFVMDHAYWGPHFTASVVSDLLTERATEIDQAGCSIATIANASELCRLTSSAISSGKVVGWFQGRMEWGPRALGNRSILGDPRRADMKEILNATIKRRESFRPFAPSVLEEHVGDWFEEDDAVPFMMQVFQVRPERRSAIPAVVHVDGSGRLQTVSARTNPLYYRLIDSFRELTGVPMLLNTSFNENEPVVCEPQEALDCFLRTKMDMLVIGNTVLARNGTMKSDL